MKLSTVGEENFIDFLKSQFDSPEPIVGIGDDCAVIPKEDGYQLVTTDAIVEGIHFLKDYITPENLGFKLVAVNVSDIAAMGGIPEHAFLTIALPSSIDFEWVKNFLRGMKLACERYSVHLLGGDTVGSKHGIFVNLTLIGSAKKIKLRSEAKVGDIVCVTSFLGDSLAGLKLMKQEIGSKFTKLVEAHTTPNVYPEQGQWLASHESVHAMMDLSDGLDNDLRKILKASNVGARVDLEKLPISNSLKRASQALDWDAQEIAVTGGEDYALLCTVASSAFLTIAKEFEAKFASPLHPIGEIIEKELKYFKDGSAINLTIQSFSHF